MENLLTEKRHGIILSLLKQRQAVTIHEFVEAVNASESTIRRDLAQLEAENKLKRVHGGAQLIKHTLSEPTITQKSQQFLDEKTMIAKYAANLIDDGDRIYLDAGTTTLQMAEYLKGKNVIVVTNGLSLINKLLESGINTYLIAGNVKTRTRALIGSEAVQSLQSFRFDKSFIGINGIHEHYGFTTPDPEEAFVKKSAIALSQQSCVLADHSKFGEVAFSKVGTVEDAMIITDGKSDESMIGNMKTQTRIEVVKA